jgi:hypothetical protein
MHKGSLVPSGQGVPLALSGVQAHSPVVALQVRPLGQLVGVQRHSPVVSSQNEPLGQLVGVHWHCPCALQTEPAGQQMAPQHSWPLGQNSGKHSHSLLASPVQNAPTPGMKSQNWQAKQQTSPQQTSLSSGEVPEVREQQCSSAPHRLAPAGRRQVPRQQVCPPQQSVSARHASPTSALHCPPQQRWPRGQPVTHWPWTVQQPVGQLSASQTHWPFAVQRWPVGQAPQLPPQPSGPHGLPVQSGAQTHCPLSQTCCPLQFWQAPPPRPQTVFAFPCWQVPLLSQQPLGQVCGEQEGVPVHWPSSQLCPGRQPGAHVPPLPQPFGPHSRPAQFGAQHSPSGLQSVAPGRQHSPSQQCPEEPLPHSPLGSGPAATAV